jgi:2-methylcitrate dehydratase PrpD
MEYIATQLADFVANVSYKDLPTAVVFKMKETILDSIGCALAARITDRARIALDLVNELGGAPQATIIGGGRTSWILAAYANAELIHSLDYEPCGPHFAHVAPFVLSPELSIAERSKASGKEFITAVAVAFEIGGRFYASVPNYSPDGKHRPIASFGSVMIYGGTAGTSHLLHLNKEQISHAFGIAGTNMPVAAGANWHILPRPSIFTKFNTLTGWIAQLSTMASLLAERGFTGDTTFLDSKQGFRSVMGAVDEFKPEVIVNGLGKEWWSEEWGVKGYQWMKAYPTCGANHSVMDLIIRIIRDNNINPNNITGMVIHGGPNTIPWTEPFADFVTFADCSHNNAYAYAVAALHGQNVGPYWLMPDVYNDPKLRKLMKSIVVKEAPGEAEIIVELTAKGQKYTAAGKLNVLRTGQAGNTRPPLSDDEIRSKFKTNASYSSLHSSITDKIMEIIYKLDEIEDVSEVLKLLG